MKCGARDGGWSDGTAKTHPTTWYNIERWASFIFDPEKKTNVLVEKKREALHEITKIAFTNENKVKGGRSSTRSYNNLARSEIAVKLLSEEIRILEPHLIICCGTDGPVNEAISRLDFRCPMIAMPHPAAHIKKMYMIEKLKNEIEELKRKYPSLTR